MEKEVELILSKLKIVIEEKEQGMYLCDKEHSKLLLDYITNLQQENELLKEENKHIFANVNDDQLLRSNAMNWAEAQDYKSRIEKAVEYLDSHKKELSHSFDEPDCDYWIATNPQDIIDILQGDDIDYKYKESDL